MKNNGFNIMGDDGVAICPILVGIENKTLELSKALNDDGIYVVAFTYPVVA